jgi:hypothetical protein
MGNGLITRDELSDKLNAELDQLGILTTVPIIPSIAYGMNNKITNNGKVSALPKITFTGQHYVNLLGKNGNCEDVSKWSDYLITHALDASNKVFGTNGMKITLTSTLGCIQCPVPINCSTSKYYCMSAYVKNGTATNIQIVLGTGATLGAQVSDTTKFTRVFAKWTGVIDNNLIGFRIIGTVGQIAYIDGVMVEEITAAQYADSSFTPNPYVDSYACLTNPYVEVKHDNLVRNGNGEEGIAWWGTNTSATSAVLSVVNNKFQFVMTGTGLSYFYQWVDVKQNTDYYIKLNGLQIQVNNATDDVALKALGPSGTFNTGANSKIKLLIMTLVAGTYAVDSIQLIEGAIAPITYLPCRIERTVIEGQFTSDDKVLLDNGRISGLINWKHKTLFGKDYDWEYNSDQVGYKTIDICTAFSDRINKGINTNYDDYVTIKYDGKILKNINASAAVDADWFGGGDQLAIMVADTDAGWTETIQPNTDEVKAWMNGWKAIRNDGTRYVVFANIINGGLPPLGVTTAIGTNSIGQNKLNVVDGTKLVVGNTIAVRCDLNNIYFFNITAIAGNQLTLNVNLGEAISTSNSILISDENQSSTRPMLKYCKNNISTDYQGYQLHYKIANPELIIEGVDFHVEGDILKLDVGDNYVNVDSGIVLGEASNPLINSDNSGYTINTIYNTTVGSYGLENPTPLTNKVETILSVYINGIYDNKWELTNAYFTNGKYRAFTPKANLDIRATYTVDYKILATQAPQVGTIACSYSTDMVTVMNGVVDAVSHLVSSIDKVDSKIDTNVYQMAEGTSNAILLRNVTLLNGCAKTFIATKDNGGLSTTINGLPLYKPNTTNPPVIMTGSACTIWYNAVNNCFFIKSEGVDVVPLITATNLILNM